MVNQISDQDIYPERPQGVEGPLFRSEGDRDTTLPSASGGDPRSPVTPVRSGYLCPECVIRARMSRRLSVTVEP